MKRFWDVAILAVAAGFFAFTVLAFRGSQSLVHAAASSMNAAAQATAAPVASAGDKAGAASYAKRCAICHGDQREGILPAFPPLIGIKRQMTDSTTHRSDSQGQRPHARLPCTAE
jgi:cytochrome c553